MGPPPLAFRLRPTQYPPMRRRPRSIHHAHGRFYMPEGPPWWLVQSGARGSPLALRFNHPPITTHLIDLQPLEPCA
eukprot:5807446-Prymnesium_polylepis.1